MDGFPIRSIIREHYFSALYASFRAASLGNLAPTALEKKIDVDVDALFTLVLKAGASTSGTKMSNELFLIDIKLS